jgi:hypothetical protein
MKTKVSFTICILLALTALSFAQGNLQFNQVLNLSNGNNYVVPSGKVLKIESINYNSPKVERNFSSCSIACPGCGASSGVGCFYFGVDYLKIADNTFTSNGGGISIGSGGSCSVCPPTMIVDLTIPAFNLPIWVGEGKVVSILASGVFISAIEFNVIQ